MINNSNAKINRIHFVMVWLGFFSIGSMHRSELAVLIIWYNLLYLQQLGFFFCHLTAVAHKMVENTSGRNAEIRHSEKLDFATGSSK